MKRTIALPFAAALTLTALLSGCATDQMKKDIADAKASAEQAQITADAANAKASSAENKADMAMDAARGAQACCDANAEKIDRMFRKAMTK
jgi:uncharacterized protein YceK